MQIKKEFKVEIPNFKHLYTGSLSALSADNNPYINKAKQIILENNLPIPETMIPSTKVIDRGNSVTFIFHWREEIENPHKKEAVAVLSDDYLNIKGYKSFYIYTSNKQLLKIFEHNEEVRLDYDLSNAIVLNSKEEELAFIEKMDFSIYFESLEKLFSSYELDTKYVKEFMSNKDIQLFLVTEEPETISDTDPREYLLDSYEEFLDEKSIDY